MERGGVVFPAPFLSLEVDMAEEIKAKMFEVIDSSCTASQPSRIHDMVIEGRVKQVVFQYGAKTMLPYAEAMKFQKEGFEVQDEKGVVVQRAPETPMETAIKLKADEVIANLSELSADALYARAVALPDGEKFKPKSSKESMIAFLTKSVKAKTAASAPEPGELSDMDEAALDKMDLEDAA